MRVHQGRDQRLDLRIATGADTDAIVVLYDEAVAWLAARGRSDQWGLTPFSALPETVELIRAISRLRLDCYAGGDGGLVAYYESAGFNQVGRFTVNLLGSTYSGCLLEQRVTAAIAPEPIHNS